MAEINTRICRSTDGTHIAFDQAGKGPALFRLHGLGNQRADWHKYGYVTHLQAEYTIITLDLRGAAEIIFR